MATFILLYTSKHDLEISNTPISGRADDLVTASAVLLVVGAQAIRQQR